MGKEFNHGHCLGHNIFLATALQLDLLCFFPPPQHLNE